MDEGAASRFVFRAAIVLGAFLFFQLELLFGKFILPWFGGTSAVWTTCLLYYQVLLLAGYAYAHGIARWPLRRQGSVHLALLGASLLWVAFAYWNWHSPILPAPDWKPLPNAPPVAGILKLLFAATALPLLVLSSTAPLLQNWFHKVHGPRAGHAGPYSLYALSNAGSLLGLITYPAAFEPLLKLGQQGMVWGVGFVFFAMFCASCALRARLGGQSLGYQNLGDLKLGDPASSESLAAMADPVPNSRKALWFALAACGSVLLLATTNFITQDVAPFPLLWVLPLCVYLLSFILVFHSSRWYRRWLFHPLFAVAAVAASVALFQGTDMGVFQQVAIFLLMLFAACMVCHGELVMLKPPASRLTSYYLAIAAGGAAGGIFVGIVAPLIFKGYWEYQLGLVLCAILLLLTLALDRSSWLHEARPWLMPALVATILLAVRGLGLIGLQNVPLLSDMYTIAAATALALVTVWLGLSGGPAWMRHPRFRWNQLSLSGGLLLLGSVMVWSIALPLGNTQAAFRNFYGALVVNLESFSDHKSDYRELLHGRITHGLQFIDPARRMTPTTYYLAESGVGIALRTNPQRARGAMNVGAVGLGVGTIAAFARPEDRYRFYEINPRVISLAEGEGGYFSFLKNAQGRMEVVPGDARLSLEAEARRGHLGAFDVLVVDAFNGDSIPVHLLTVEAMRLYLKHLHGADSVIAVHISNRNLRLEPVVAGLAEKLNLHATLVSISAKSDYQLRSDWVLVSPGRNALNATEVRAAGFPMLRLNAVARTRPPLWTDDYSNILQLIGGN